MDGRRWIEVWMLSPWNLHLSRFYSQYPAPKTNISQVGKRTIVFKHTLGVDMNMLVPRMVTATFVLGPTGPTGKVQDRLGYGKAGSETSKARVEGGHFNLAIKWCVQTGYPFKFLWMSIEGLHVCSQFPLQLCLWQVSEEALEKLPEFEPQQQLGWDWWWSQSGNIYRNLSVEMVSREAGS